jgi:hypothetical protein
MVGVISVRPSRSVTAGTAVTTSDPTSAMRSGHLPDEIAAGTPSG